jgi:hypothetical protein
MAGLTPRTILRFYFNWHMGEAMSKISKKQTTTIPQDQHVDIREAAIITGFSVGTIYVRVHQRTIPVYKTAYRLMFDPQELREWMKHQPSHVSVTLEQALENQKQKKH